MSKESLEQFIQKVADSNELQARIGQRIDVESLIALGAEHGCEFSVEDLVENAELSDEELDGVAGGVLMQAGSFKGKISLTRFQDGNRLGFAVAERNTNNA